MDKRTEKQRIRLEKKKSTQKKKLDRFFGSNVNVDVSVPDLEKYGLTEMLKSRVPLCYFLHSLLEELCSENLFFYLEVEAFEKANFESREEQDEYGFRIYDLFIDRNGVFQVNIDNKISLMVLDALERGEQNAFQPAKDHIEKLMEPVYKKFETSPLFEKMKYDLGKSPVYDEATKKEAMRLIEKNVKSMTREKEGEWLQIHNKLLRSMCHSFCQQNLGVDFEDAPTESDEPSTTPSSIGDSKQNGDAFMAYLDSM